MIGIAAHSTSTCTAFNIHQLLRHLEAALSTSNGFHIVHLQHHRNFLIGYALCALHMQFVYREWLSCNHCLTSLGIDGIGCDGYILCHITPLYRRVGNDDILYCTSANVTSSRRSRQVIAFQTYLADLQWLIATVAYCQRLGVTASYGHSSISQRWCYNLYFGGQQRNNSPAYRTIQRYTTLITQHHLRHQVIVCRFLTKLYLEATYFSPRSLYRSQRKVIYTDAQVSILGRGRQCVPIATLCIQNRRTIHITQHIIQRHQYFQCRHLVAVSQCHCNLHLFTRMALCRCQRNCIGGSGSKPCAYCHQPRYDYTFHRYITLSIVANHLCCLYQLAVYK